MTSKVAIAQVAATTATHAIAGVLLVAIAIDRLVARHRRHQEHAAAYGDLLAFRFSHPSNWCRRNEHPTHCTHWHEPLASLPHGPALKPIPGVCCICGTANFAPG